MKLLKILKLYEEKNGATLDTYALNQLLQNDDFARRQFAAAIINDSEILKHAKKLFEE